MLAIRAENLSKTYTQKRLLGDRHTPALKDLNLTIEAGEIFGLLGLNGSGKTTAIKLILGLLFPTSGRIFVHEKLMPNREEQSRLGYLPEIPYFYPYLTPEETLDFYGKLSGMAGTRLKKRMEETLRLVGLLPHRTRRIREFSKGMQQRVGVAQAILHDPDILIFDEPITGLDPIGLREMRELILNLKKSGKTIFFSSHIISEAEKICDRVAILHRGKLLTILSDIRKSKISLEERFVKVVRRAGSNE